LAYVVAALWATLGARALLVAAWGRAARVAGPVACVACAACVLLPLFLHAREADERGNHGVEDYASNMLASLAPGGVIFSSQWDHFVAGAWYLQAVEGERTDVAVVDYELLKRSWYLRRLRQQYPEWTAACRPEIDAFLAAVHPFEHGRPYAAEPLQAAFEAMVNRLMETAAATRPLYVTRERAGDAFGGGWKRHPEGAAFRLYRGDDTPPFVALDLAFRPFPKENVYFAQLRAHYAYAFLNQGIYLGLRGDLEGCERFFAKARALEPGSGEIAEWWGRLQASKAASGRGP